MIAAVGSVLLTPWNWYNNPDAIHYTLGILGALIGPLFGILIAGYYVDQQAAGVGGRPVHHGPERAATGSATATTPTRSGPRCSAACPSSPRCCCPSCCSTWATRPTLTWIADYSWFLGCGLGFVAFSCWSAAAPRIDATWTATSSRPRTERGLMNDLDARISGDQPQHRPGHDRRHRPVRPGGGGAGDRGRGRQPGHGPGVDREPLRRGPGRPGPARGDRRGRGGRGGRLRHRAASATRASTRRASWRRARWSGSPRRPCTPPRWSGRASAS